jgi:DNA-binding transcriptional LysR family regulator
MVGVDVVRDGFDCVLRVGPLRDSRLTARKLGALAMVSCASPAYLARFGVPLAPQDLTNHPLVHYEQTFGASQPAFEY